MQISELVDRSGVPLATIKYYIREGFLPAGTSNGGRRATYSDWHLARLKLIRSLVTVAKLPLLRVRMVLEILDGPSGHEAILLKQAMTAIAGDIYEESQSRGSPQRAVEVMELLGWSTAPEQPGMAHLQVALSAADEAGVAPTTELLLQYGRLMGETAIAELSQLPVDPVAMVQHAVLAGTLHEPVLAALRLLALQDTVARQHAN